jgi:hypothetical protein
MACNTRKLGFNKPRSARHSRFHQGQDPSKGGRALRLESRKWNHVHEEKFWICILICAFARTLKERAIAQEQMQKRIANVRNEGLKNQECFGYVEGS